jgi:integrase
MAQIQQQGDGGWWRLVISYQGRRWTKALGTQLKKEAEGLRARAEENLKLVRRGIIPFNPGAGDDLITVLLSDGRLQREPDAKKAVSLGELVARYQAERPAAATEANSRATEDIHLRHVLRVLGAKISVGDVPGALQRYIDARGKERGGRGGRSQRGEGEGEGSSIAGAGGSAKHAKTIARYTIRKELTTLATLWNRWGVRGGHVGAALNLRGLQFPKATQKPPFQTWEQIERKVRAGAGKELWDCLFLSKPQVDELVDFVRGDRGPGSGEPKNALVAAMFAFVAYSGARRSEMLRARVEDFNFQAGNAYVDIREKKKDRSREVTFRRIPMKGRLLTAMDEWIHWYHPGSFECMAFAKPGLAVPGCEIRDVLQKTDKDIPKIIPAGPLTRNQAHNEFQAALAGSKWEVITGWHTLRHSFISQLLAAGVAERTIMELAGHLDAETSRRYQHVFPGRVDEAMEKLHGGR